MSHWNDYSVLSKGQVWYAADDALVCYELFVALAEDIFGIIDESEYVAECKPFMDTVEITKSKNERKQKSENDVKAQKKQKVAKQRKDDKRKRAQEARDSATKYTVYKPDGTVLFTCGKWLFESFLLQRLAERKEVDDGEACTLVFADYESKSDTQTDEESNIKDNQCFVCGVQGTEDNGVEINRFDVFCTCYWKNIQNEEIQQRALVGNMIALCHKSENDCFQKAKQCQMEYVRLLSEKHPNIVKHPHLVREQDGYKAARSAAKALDKAHENIPMDRKMELVRVVADWFGLDYDVMEDLDESVHYEQLLKINREDEEKGNNDDESDNREVFRKCVDELLKDEKEELRLHSEQLVNEYKGNEREFVEMWRQRFVQDMQPKLVPSYWPLTRV